MAFPDDYKQWGGSSADFTTSAYDIGGGVDVIRAVAQTVTIWDGSEGGAQIIDLYNENGDPVTELVSASSGLLRPFWAPLQYQRLWAQADGGDRVRLVPLEGPPPSWDATTGKPATFPPSPHSHDAADIVGLSAAAFGLGDVDNTSDLDKPISDDTRAELTRYLRKARSGSIIDLGNSIASGGVLSYYDRTASGTISFSPVSYMGWAMPKVQGRFWLMGVAAQGGFTAEQIRDTHLGPAIAAGPDYIHMQVLTNNINLVITGVQTLAALKAVYMQMIDAIVAAGITPIIATVNPINTLNTGTGLTVMTKVNGWLKRLAAKNGWPLADYHTALVNPADNNYVTGYSSDGTHLTAAGARVMGAVLADTLNAIPATARSPLFGAYNPNLVLHDCALNAAGSDKFAGFGTSTGGFAFKTSTGPFHKGNSIILTRGTAGNYGMIANADPVVWVAGHRIRVSFNIDASAVPAGGTWRAYLYNFTPFQVICGYSLMSDTLTNKSITVAGATTTAASKLISAAAGTFKPEHVGCVVSGAVTVNNAIPAGTLITGVSADGTQAYMSADASLSGAGTVSLTVAGPPCPVIFEFVVQADMVGDTIGFYYGPDDLAGTTLACSQITVQDLDALEIAA